MASADISSDLTGFSLGEKKAIKEAMAHIGNRLRLLC